MTNRIEKIATEAKADGDGHAGGKIAREESGPRSQTAAHARIAALSQLVFIFLGVTGFCYFAAGVMIPMVLALIVSMMLRPPVIWLKRWRIPKPVGAVIVISVLSVIVACGLNYMSKPALQWVADAPETLPRLKEKFKDILRPAARLSEAASKVGNLDPVDDPTKKVQAVEVKNNAVAQTVFTRTGTLLAGIGETVGLVFLLLAFGDGFLQKLILALPSVPDKKRAVKISQEIQHSISTYLFSVGLINIGFGILVGLGLYFVGMPNPLMWGAVAAFANFIPYFGPVMGIVVIGLSGLLGFETIGRGLAPAGVYLALHIIEANFVTPFILGKRFTLNPVIIFVALIFWAWVWGIIGALLAVPMLVTVQALCEFVPAFSSTAALLSSKD